MESYLVINCFHALAQETRLRIFRLLIRHGAFGLTAGAIATTLSCAHSTLSFHLKVLNDAGLVRLQKKGRLWIYSANFTQTKTLIDFLTENFCSQETPLPPSATGAKEP